MPQTSPTPNATRPSLSLNEVEEVAPHVARRRHRRGYVEAGFGGEFRDPGQKRPLNDRRARHFVVALASQDDLLGHTAEGLSEIGEVRDRVAQLFEQSRVELVTFERGQRVGVEADSAIDPPQAIAHAPNNVDQHGRRGLCDFGKGVASDAQGGHGCVGAHCRRAWQSRERPGFADETRSLHRRNWNDAARAVGGDDHFARQDHHDAVARFSLDHENRLRIERLQFARPDQKRNFGFGEVAERARRPDGGAQLR